NELSPDTGTGLHRLGTLTAQQVVWRQQLPPPHILAKGGRPVIDDINRVPGQRFHQAIMSPAPALQRQLEFLPSHAPKHIERNVVLPAEPLVFVVGQALPLRGLYASPSSSSPAS